jgi:hypothetical protein
MLPQLTGARLRPPVSPANTPMNRFAQILTLLLVIAAGIAGYYWWQQEAPAPAPPPQAQAPAAPPAPPPAEPQVQHPIEEAMPAPPVADLPPVDESDKVVLDALVGMLGADAVGRFLNTTGFVRRFVVTVDNLPRQKAAVRSWPVQPMAGRIAVQGGPDDSVLGPDNAQRYASFVKFVEGADTGKAVATYVSLYPLFQKAYEDLGYPNRYFNDRFIEVIDHLLATPEVAGPIRLVRPDVKGPIKLEAPYARYEFADPALESRSAGQKMLIRMGPENAAKLKAKLRELRRQLTAGAKKP